MDSMAKCNLIKTFLQSYSEYLKNRNEASLNTIHRNLKILSVNVDLSIFDPDTSEATEFYVSLHELMMSLRPNSGSGVTWIAIDVLQLACKNLAARSALTDIYKFTPILSQILGDNLTLDKRIKVLKLLEVLTYSARITWQEAHLSSLVTTLTNWIMSDEEQTVIDVSLSVLVNLCYKNLPSLYTLLHGVNMQEFLRSLSKLKATQSCHVQICKMLLILEEVNGPLEENAIASFVCSMFTLMSTSFSKKDTYVIRHIVDFFSDIQTNSRLLNILHSHSSFQREAEILINQVINETQPDEECIALVFELFNVLMTLKAPGLSSLYLQLITLSMRWIRTDVSCTPALLLIRSICEESRATPVLTDAIFEQLNEGMDLLLLVLFPENDASAAARARQPALIQLLCAMASAEPLRRKLVDRLKPADIGEFLKPFSVLSKPINHADAFLVNAINLVSCLAEHNREWDDLLSSVIACPHILTILANALVTGDQHVKELVLTIVDKDNFPKSRMSELAAAMCVAEPSSCLPMRRGGVEMGGPEWQMDDLAPLVTVKEEGILSKFIKKLEEADERGEIKDLATSAVMQLYEYKLAARGSCERALNNSLEAASNRTIHLEHRVARMSAEASRFHKLLFHNQQSIEGLREEKASLVTKLSDAESKSTLLNSMLKSKQIQVKTSEELLAGKCAELQEANKKIDNLQTASAIKEKSNLALLDELKNDIRRLNERIDKRDKIIKQKDQEVLKHNQTIENYHSEKANLEQVYQAQLLDIKNKDSLIEKMCSENKELKKFKETVFRMASSEAQ